MKLDFIEKMLLLEQQQKELDNQKLSLKDDFEKFIKDKSIPIYKRWNIFFIADNKLKNHLDCLPSPRGKFLNEQIKDMKESPECYGRGKRIDTKDFFEDSYSEEEQKFYPAGFEYDCDLKEAKEFSKKDMADSNMFQLMEEIMQKNLGSFCYDW